MTTTMLTSTQSIAAQVSCPVCGSDCNQPPLYHYTATQAAAHFCPETRNADRNHRLKAKIAELWQGESSQVLQCPTCGFGFGYPFVGGDEEFYSILHEQHGYPGWRWDYDIALQSITHQSQISTGLPLRILDVGAGVGKFLQALDAGWECHAVEGSDVTRKLLEERGIHVFPSLSEAIASDAGSFDCITLFQVLEHLSDFYSVFQLCRQLLKPGGKLVITVPNGEALIRQEQLTGCPDMPPNHINKWSPKSLAHCFEQVGLRVEDTHFEPNSWKNIAYAMQITLMSDATNPQSLAAQVYRIPNRSLRIPLLMGLSLPVLVKALPHWQELSQGQAFAMVGVA